MKNLVILAHPDINTSIYNREVFNKIKNQPNTKIKDIYKMYPDFNLDSTAEKNDLLRSDRIIFQFPLFWYGEPSLLKKWQESVLSADLCAGPQGDKLKGKGFSISVTGGGSLEEYERKGLNYRVEDLWKPFIYLSKYCQMNFESIIYTRVPYASRYSISNYHDDVESIMNPHVEKMLELMNRPHVKFNI